MSVWADARSEEEAVHALLDGKKVYDSEELAIKVTGRQPAEIVIIARKKK